MLTVLLYIWLIVAALIVIASDFDWDVLIPALGWPFVALYIAYLGLRIGVMRLWFKVFPKLKP